MSAGLCDSCGQSAASEHIARRLRRLELATRFRPVHIGVLFMAEAPPLRLEDYFYYGTEGSVGQPSERPGLARILFESLVQGVGISQEAGKTDEACLGEFQRAGFFLADAVECPVEEIVAGLREETGHANNLELVLRYAPTIVKRLQFSYKPKHIVLLSTRTRHLIPILRQAGLGDQLLLYQGLPIHFPHPNDPTAQAQFRTGLAEVLSTASSRSRSA